MTEITSWSETDASNNSAAPAGAPEGMAFSGVNDVIRAMMGAVRRTFGRQNPVYASTGTAGGYLVSHAVALSTYSGNEVLAFRAHTASAAAPTVSFDSLAAIAMKKYTTSGKADVAASDIQSGQMVAGYHDGTHFVVMTPTAPAGTAIAATNITSSGLTVNGGVLLGRVGASVGAIQEFNYVTSSTWTPVIAGASTAGTQSYSNQIGRYTRINNLIMLWGRVTMTAKDGATAGNFTITGLPFASVNITGLEFPVSIGFAGNVDVTAGKVIAATIAPNSTAITMNEIGDNAAYAALGAAAIQATTDVSFSATYLST
jgi:hypothetical protein